MEQLNLKISRTKKEELVISPQDLIDLYLVGIPLCFPDGANITMETIRQKIIEVQAEVEKMLSISLQVKLVEETQDFVSVEFRQWGHIKTVYPILKPLSLKGVINDIVQTVYPAEWLSIKRTNDPTKYRNLYLIPNTKSGAKMNQNGFMYSGISPHMGFFGNSFIPNYWRIEYMTGFEEVPNDIVSLIGKMSAIPILAMSGDLIYGTGVTSQSIAIDGVSQNYATAKSSQGGAFAGRIKLLNEEIALETKRIKGEYLGIQFEVV